MPNSSLNLLYQSPIQCHVNYGLEIWVFSISTDRLQMPEKINPIKNRKSYNFHAESLKKCNIITVTDQYQQKVATLVLQMKLNTLPYSFQKLHASYFSQTEWLTKMINVAKQT